MTECNHDYENPIRLGRAFYVCRHCSEDISLTLVLIAELEKNSSPPDSDSEDLPS